MKHMAKAALIAGMALMGGQAWAQVTSGPMSFEDCGSLASAVKLLHVETHNQDKSEFTWTLATLIASEKLGVSDAVKLGMLDAAFQIQKYRYEIRRDPKAGVTVRETGVMPIVLYKYCAAADAAELHRVYTQ